MKIRLSNSIRRKLSVILFWMHITIIFLGLFLGLFVSMHVLLTVVSIHRMHFLVFNGCLLSKIESKLGSFSNNKSFLQHAVYKFTGRNINDKQERILDYGFVMFTIGLALVV